MNKLEDGLGVLLPKIGDHPDNSWIFRTLLAMSTLVENRLIEASLVEQIGMNALSHVLPLSTKSADEPTIGMVSIFLHLAQ